MLGVGSASIGASALIGSGAFTRIESQRRVKIEVAKDPDAYLGLDGCPGSPNRSYTNIDESGHLEIDMSPDNPTDDGGQGINSDSRSYFDDVFQICNQGKQGICVWIYKPDDWPMYKDGPTDEDEPRVEFYYGSSEGADTLVDLEEQSILGRDNAFFLEVGECICVGIATVTKNLKEGDQLLENLEDEIVIHADVDCPNDEDVPPVVSDTAWAILKDDIDDPGSEDTDNRLNQLTGVGQNRWGWFMPYDISSGEVEAEFHAGAGLNRINGTYVSDVTIDSDGENLTVDIEDLEFTDELSETHLYVDTTTEGIPPAAPGRFTYNDGSNEFDTDETKYTIPLDDIGEDGVGENDEVFLALHGVVDENLRQDRP